MNVFFVFDDGSMTTPPLGGTILPGITRASLLTLAKDKGIKVREDRYSIDQWRRPTPRSGRLREAFACGTAAVVTPIGTVAQQGWRVQDRQRRPRHQDRGAESQPWSTSSAAAADARLDPQGVLTSQRGPPARVYLEERPGRSDDLNSLPPFGTFLSGTISTTAAVAVGKAERQHFRHELADLARREIDHGRDLSADQARPACSAP